MEYSAHLDRLPETIAFPARLKDKIAFDAARGQLVYRGFMTKCTYDELSALSDDADYHRALEQLFVLTSAEVAPRAAPRVPKAAVLLATAGAIAIALAALWVSLRQTSAEKPTSQTPGVAVSTAAR
jgi:hypothetical protein